MKTVDRFRARNTNKFVDCSIKVGILYKEHVLKLEVSLDFTTFIIPINT